MKHLLDSNVLIYLAASIRPPDPWIRGGAVSGITKVETLGYHKLGDEEARDIMRMPTSVTLLDVTTDVIDRAVALRQQRKMSPGDALIAATATQHRLPLVTHNINDFTWIDGLEIIDPLV